MSTALDMFSAPFALDTLRTLLQQRQPMRRAFGIEQIWMDGCPVPVSQRDVAASPFCALAEFAAAPRPERRMLLVAPLSGHFAFILREMVTGFLPTHTVYVTDWLNARFVPLSAGDFGFDDNIGAIIDSIRRLGPGIDLCALCQGVVPALAATAILAEEEPALAPRTLTLLGGPVDPLANPTRVVRLLRQRSLSDIEASALGTVDAAAPGAGRRVYPAHYQLSALLAYLYRHCGSGGELVQKVFADDGLDTIRFPFLQLFASLMDLPARYFLENLQKVFIERHCWTEGLRWRGQRVDFGAIRSSALMTVEGASDDIAAPGQTRAAHTLCPNVPDGMRRSLVLERAGHFSLFYGRTWRDAVLPAIRPLLQLSPAPAFREERTGARRPAAAASA